MQNKSSPRTKMGRLARQGLIPPRPETHHTPAGAHQIVPLRKGLALSTAPPGNTSTPSKCSLRGFGRQNGSHVDALSPKSPPHNTKVN